MIHYLFPLNKVYEPNLWFTNKYIYECFGWIIIVSTVLETLTFPADDVMLGILFQICRSIFPTNNFWTNESSIHSLIVSFCLLKYHHHYGTISLRGSLSSSTDSFMPLLSQFWILLIHRYVRTYKNHVRSKLKKYGDVHVTCR